MILNATKTLFTDFECSYIYQRLTIVLLCSLGPPVAQFVTRYLLALWAFLTIFIMFASLFHGEEQSDCSHKVCSCLNPFCFGLVCFSFRGDFVLECSFMFEYCKIRMPWIMNCWNWCCRSFACEHNWSCFDKPRRCGKLVLLLITKKEVFVKTNLKMIEAMAMDAIWKNWILILLM